MLRKGIDLWKLNPNWKFATQHGLASRPGVQPSGNSSRNTSILMCPCCLHIIHKDPVPIFQNPKELYFLGYGFPLFYSLLQYCIISLFILVLSQSSILLYLSLRQECEESIQGLLNVEKSMAYSCQSVFVKMSRISADINQFQYDRIIRSLSFIGQSFLMVFLRDIQKKLAEYHNQRNTRIKDFSIIIRNLPKKNGIQKSISQFLKSLDIQARLKIEEIFLIPEIDNFYSLEKQKKQIMNQIKRSLKDEQQSNSLRYSLQSELDRVNLSLIQTCRRIQTQYQKDQLLCSKAIVILSTKQLKLQILKAFSESSLQQKQKLFSQIGGQVSVQSAPEPREILWKNINCPKYKRWLRIFLGWALSAIFLALTTIVFYFLITTRSKSRQISVLVITLLLIQLFNKYIMKIFLHWFSSLERHETCSERQFSYASKYTIGMFFTTAVMSLLVQAVIYENFSFEYGIVEGESIMFFFNAFLANLLWILNPFYYLRKIKRWWNYGKKNITQKEANLLMEDYPYDIGKRYAEVLQTMWFTFLYASLLPLGAFLSLIGFCMYYWVDKYNLLRRSKVQNIVESRLPLNAVKLMEITLLWKPLGELIFDIRLRGIYYPQTIIMICLSIVFLLLPWNRFLDFFFSQKFNLSRETYLQSRYKFTETYQTVDPIQRMLALQKFIETQNKVRKQTKFLDSHSILEIRRYDEDRISEQQVSKRITKQQIGEFNDFSIILKTGAIVQGNEVSSTLNKSIIKRVRFKEQL